MEMKPVASSNIKAVGYENGELRVEFANGNVWSYTGRGLEEHHKAMLSAPSVGKYFAANIRSNPGIQARKVEG